MLKLFLRFVASMFRSRNSRAVENLALRHQIEVLQRNADRPLLRWRDRAFWDLLSCVWPDWRKSLYIVQPETLIRWHRQGFRYYWRWKSRIRWPGRPQTPREVRDLIRQMSRDNPLWGAPRIHSELLKLGISVSQATVSKYMVRHRKPPSQSWRTFLSNHSKDIISIDFFTVPTAVWTGQQVVEAFPWDTAPRWLIRDRDGKFGLEFDRRVWALGIEQVLTSPHSPWQKGYASHCTSCVGSDATSAKRLRFESFPPWVLTGGWSPGCSYRHSFMSLYA